MGNSTFPSLLNPALRLLSNHPHVFTQSFIGLARAASTVSTHWSVGWDGEGEGEASFSKSGRGEVPFSSNPLFAEEDPPVSISSPKTFSILSSSRFALATFASHFSFAMRTNSLIPLSLTNRTPRLTTGVSIRIEHRMEHTTLLSLPVIPDSLNPASRAAATNLPPVSTLDASTDRMNGSNRMTRVHSGSTGVVLIGVLPCEAVSSPVSPSVSSPSFFLTAAMMSSTSAGSWFTYTHSPPFCPSARDRGVGSANRLTRPAHEEVVKKSGCLFTSATTGRAR